MAEMNRDGSIVSGKRVFKSVAIAQDGLPVSASNPLPVSATIDSNGLATEATLDAVVAGLADVVVELNQPAAVDDAADITLNNGSQTLLLAADLTRRSALIVADEANTVALRIGANGTVGASRGAPLKPGQGVTVTATGAVYGWATAANQKVAILIEKN